MEAQNYIEEIPTQPVEMVSDKPEINADEAIQTYLRKGIENDRGTLNKAFEGLFENLKWPSYQEWLEREKAQRQSNNNQ